MGVIMFKGGDVFYHVFAIKQKVLALVRAWYSRAVKNFELSKVRVEMLDCSEINSLVQEL